jgi:hypothetical protein
MPDAPDDPAYRFFQCWADGHRGPAAPVTCEQVRGHYAARPWSTLLTTPAALPRALDASWLAWRARRWQVAVANPAAATG